MSPQATLQSTSTPSHLLKRAVKFGPGPNGFTLIELLMVIAIIGILAAVTFGITDGVRDTRGRAKARAGLALMAQALGSFKNKHADFPWAETTPEDSAKELFKALTGWKKFDYSAPGSPAFVDKTTAEVPAQGPKPFIDTSKLNYIETSAPYDFNPEITGNTSPANHLLIDPWGNPYRYYYKTGPTGWENFGFVLYSMGPDGKHTPAS